ncbi:MAG: T9SS type A sorting domain-containing protein [Bacteroidales bacterium]|nr:T9SS type A sorting domain-containing protein [Bacteroidales bacterium]
MKKKIFTTILSGLLLSGFMNFMFAQAGVFGTGWGEPAPGEPKIIEEDLTGFPFFHSDFNPNEGNSSHTLEKAGYKDTVTYRVCINSTDTIFYEFHECAFAPNWQPAYGYKDSVDGVASVVPAEVSRGFVEIARFDTVYAKPPLDTDSGHFIIDMRQVEYVEVIQFTHSSCGGNKRGFTLRKSTDNGMTWDTVRNQVGRLTGNTPDNDLTAYDCQESAHGMVWQDGLYLYDQNVMLKFSYCMGQTLRIHDFRAYGWVQQVGVDEKELEKVSVYSAGKNLFLSEPSDIVIFDINGRFVKKALNVVTYSMSDLPEGLYIVKARTDKGIVTRKIMNQ